MAKKRTKKIKVDEEAKDVEVIEPILDSYETVKDFVDNHPAKQKFSIWWQNYQYVDGKQTTYTDPYTGDQEDLTDYVSEIRGNPTTRNFMAAIMWVFLGMVNQRSEPVVSVMPRTNSVSDRNGARMAEFFIKYLWQEQNLARLMSRSYYHMWNASVAYAKVYFDKNLMAEVYQGNEIVKKKVGKIVIKTIRPFNLFFDPYAKDLEDVLYGVELELSSVYRIKLKYGKEVDSEGSIDNPEYYVGEENWTFPKFDKPVIIYKAFEKISDKWYFTYFAGGQIIYEEVLDVFPYVKMVEKDEDKFYGYSTSTQLTQIQRDYNKMNSFLMDQVELLGNPFILAPDGADFHAETEPKVGRIIYYRVPRTGENKPEFSNGQPLSSATVNMLELIRRDKDDVSNFHPFSMGGVAEGTSHYAGYTIDKLMNADKSAQSSAILQGQYFLKNIFFKALELARIHYKDDRLLRIFDKNQSYLVKRLKQGGFSYADVSIDLGSSLPLSKMERINLITMLYEKQIITPEDRQKALEYLELGDLSSTFADNEISLMRLNGIIEDLYNTKLANIDVNTANPEEFIDKLPKISVWDDVEYIIHGVEKEMQSYRFNETDEAIQNSFVLFRKLCMAALAEKMAEQEILKMKMQAYVQEKIQGMQQQIQPQMGQPPVAGGQSMPPQQPAGQPEQPPMQAPANEREMLSKVVEALQQGASPEQLIQSGVPQEIVAQALQLINNQKMG